MDWTPCGGTITRRQFKFADGRPGEALDELFAAGDGLDNEVNGRIAIVCRLFEQMPGSDGVHEIAHAELGPSRPHPEAP
jgi:hypothetical protein